MLGKRKFVLVELVDDLDVGCDVNNSFDRFARLWSPARY